MSPMLDLAHKTPISVSSLFNYFCDVVKTLGARICEAKAKVGQDFFSPSNEGSAEGLELWDGELGEDLPLSVVGRRAILDR